MAQKICPACKKGNGPRTKNCECGHVFIADRAIPASDKMMTLPLKPKPTITETIVSKAPVESKQPVESKPATTQKPVVSRLVNRSGARIIVAPSGPCPLKPKGYKDRWPDGPASDEVVSSWAVDVYNSNTRIALDAVVYWARNFWDINGKDFARIVSLVHQAISTGQASSESSDVNSDSDSNLDDE